MATIEDAIYEVARSSADPADKIKIIEELIRALPTDRWTFRYVIWCLVSVVIMTLIGLLILWGIGRDLKDFPPQVITLATTALGALAAYLVPPRSTPADQPQAAGQPPAGGQQPAGD